MHRLGFEVLARNVRTASGEIDLIAADEDTIAFVEVKTRRVRPGASPAAELAPCEGLRPAQRARIRRAAGLWLDEAASRPRTDMVRFDAIGVVVDRNWRLLRLDHLEGAW